MRFTAKPARFGLLPTPDLRTLCPRSVGLEGTLRSAGPPDTRGPVLARGAVLAGGTVIVDWLMMTVPGTVGRDVVRPGSK